MLGVGLLILGVVLMLLWRATGHESFFGRKREVVDPDVAAGRSRRGHGARGGRLMAGTIVLGYDGSTGANTALEEAVRFAPP